jgi:hypothetical protein
MLFVLMCSAIIEPRQEGGGGFIMLCYKIWSQEDMKNSRILDFVVVLSLAALVILQLL